MSHGGAVFNRVGTAGELVDGVDRNVNYEGGQEAARGNCRSVIGAGHHLAGDEAAPVGRVGVIEGVESKAIRQHIHYGYRAVSRSIAQVLHHERIGAGLAVVEVAILELHD